MIDGTSRPLKVPLDLRHAGREPALPHLQSGQDSLPVTRRAAQRGRLPSAASPQLIGQLAFLDAPDRLSVLMVYNVEVDGSDGVSELFCLATTLLDHQAYPAEAVVAAYPQRWSASETTIGENTRPRSGRTRDHHRGRRTRDEHSSCSTPTTPPSSAILSATGSSAVTRSGSPRSTQMAARACIPSLTSTRVRKKR